MGRPTTVRQCTDAATDELLILHAAPLALACPTRDVQRTGGTVTINAACVHEGEPVTSSTEITGSFDSTYTMQVTATAPHGVMTKAMTGTWLGPCAAGQKPGDEIMEDGRRSNILEAQEALPR